MMGSWLVASFVHIGELASNVQVRMRARVVVSVDYKPFYVRISKMHPILHQLLTQLYIQ